MSTATTEFCVVCGDDREMQREQKKVEYTVRGEKVTVELPVKMCPECGSEEIDDAFGRDPVECAYEAYRQRHDLLFPEEIKAIRERFKLSQRSFAALLGMSEATVNRYEGGGLQDATHDNAIRACNDPEFVQELLDRRGHGLSEWQRKRVEHAIAGEIKNKQKFVFDPRMLVSMPSEISEITGYRMFSYDRYAAVVVWFCRNISAVTPTKLNKLLFYADFLHFKRNTVSLTGTAYRRIQFGPVPADYRGLQRFLELDEYVEVNERQYQNGNTGEEYSLGPKAMELRFEFSQEELEVLKCVAEAFKDITPRDISDRSHRETAWQNTDDRQMISYREARALSLSSA